MNNYNNISSFDDYKIVRYRPSWFHLFGKYYPEKITLRRTIRFVLAMPCGYELFSLIHNDVVQGYCVIQSGKTMRFNFASDKDIVVGPYYILPDFQGRSLASKLIKAILEFENGKYTTAFAYIKKNNIASIKTVEKLGFSYYSNAEVTKKMAFVKKNDDDNAQYIIMKMDVRR